MFLSITGSFTLLRYPHGFGPSLVGPPLQEHRGPESPSGSPVSQQLQWFLAPYLIIYSAIKCENCSWRDSWQIWIFFSIYAVDFTVPQGSQNLITGVLMLI